MERLEQGDAREHLEMVERILAESSQRLCYGGENLVWGLYSALTTVLWQLVGNGLLPRAALWTDGVFLFVAVAFSVVRGRMKSAHHVRRSLVQRESFNVIWLTIGMAFVVNVGAYNIFNGWAAAGISEVLPKRSFCSISGCMAIGARRSAASSC